MEIGAIGLLLIIGLGILWVECTKTGERFISWVSKTFCDVNLNKLED